MDDGRTPGEREADRAAQAAAALGQWIETRPPEVATEEAMRLDALMASTAHENALIAPKKAGNDAIAEERRANAAAALEAPIGVRDGMNLPAPGAPLGPGATMVASMLDLADALNDPSVARIVIAGGEHDITRSEFPERCTAVIDGRTVELEGSRPGTPYVDVRLERKERRGGCGNAIRRGRLSPPTAVTQRRAEAGRCVLDAKANKVHNLNWGFNAKIASKPAYAFQTDRRLTFSLLGFFYLSASFPP